MNSRKIVLMAIAAGVLAGCGATAVVEESASAPAAAVEVTPVAPQPAPAGPAEQPTPPQQVSFDVKAFLRAAPPNPNSGPDGLERSREWVVLDWANPAEVAAWKYRESLDDVVLVIRLKGGPRDKVAVMRPAALQLRKDGKLRMDVFNGTNREMAVAFAVQSTVDDVYSESVALPAKPGWTHLEFDLAAQNFKTAASDWKHTTTLWGPEEVRRLVLLVYDAGAGAVIVDRIEVDAEEAPPEPAAGGPGA